MFFNVFKRVQFDGQIREKKKNSIFFIIIKC